MVSKHNNDRLGLGSRRGITVTVTTTPSTLATLINTAIAGRTLLAPIRQINIRNTGAATIFILEREAQTVAEGIQIRAGEERFYELSTTGLGVSVDQDGTATTSGVNILSGTYFACAAATVSMTIEEMA